MKAALLYATTFGKTRRVVSEVARQLEFAVDIYDVKHVDPPIADSYELLLWFCPTYGDEELQEDMESFLLRFHPDLSTKKFCVCELGNYYGYDNFQFGALRIIRNHLLALRASEICEPLSLDSHPHVPWDHVSDWVKQLNRVVQEHGRH
jgi:flavodoxin